MLSQLASAVVGRGPLYFVTIGSVLAVLCLSANTSFVGYPRLCRMVARDGFLPQHPRDPGPAARLFGRHPVAGGLCGLLLVDFGGITDRLIPLFAVGAFLSFTLSQAGMAVHWSRPTGEDLPGGRHGRRVRLAINGAGALATGICLAVILAAKFVEGAWITVLIIPAVLALLKLIKRYYTQIDRQLDESGPLDLADTRAPVVIVPIAGWDRLAARALRYALRLSSDVVAVHLTRLEGAAAEEHEASLRRRWHADVERPVRAHGGQPPRLVQIPSPYRSITAPLLKFIMQLRGKDSGRAIAVVIPALIEAHWWDRLMHTGRVRRLRTTLLRHGGPDLAVLTVPWNSR